MPEYFPSPNPGDYEVVEDLTGFRPLRLSGVRVEVERLNSDTVIHAYGTTAGGYILSFGIAKEVALLLDDALPSSISWQIPDNLTRL